MKNSENQQFASIIKLRHLSTAVRNNWDMLGKIKSAAENLLTDAQAIMLEMGSSSGKTQFELDFQTLNESVTAVQNQLDIFAAYINGISAPTQDIQKAWTAFNDTLDAAAKKFTQVQKYPKKHFISNDAHSTWGEIWIVIQSNLSAVQGIGEAAFVKVNMMQAFSENETEQLLKSIAQNIPDTFNLLDAKKYRSEYLQAVKEIEEESNKNDNLWDRFLNFLAGNIPFKQSPEERVMMRRWLDGERGNL